MGFASISAPKQHNYRHVRPLTTTNCCCSASVRFLQSNARAHRADSSICIIYAVRYIVFSAVADRYVNTSQTFRSRFAYMIIICVRARDRLCTVTIPIIASTRAHSNKCTSVDRCGSAAAQPRLSVCDGSEYIILGWDLVWLKLSNPTRYATHCGHCNGTVPQTIGSEPFVGYAIGKW